MDESRLIKRKGNKVKVNNNGNGNGNVINNLIDALFTDDFNQIVDSYTNTELDFQTIVLFIKLYMMAYKVTDNKEKIKSLVNFAITDSFTRKEIIKSFNEGTIIKTFLEITDRKLK